MANRMLKPYSFLFYLLSLTFSFFVGILIAGLVNAGKGQMLAAGAIVLSYGVISAGIGLILTLFLAYKTNSKFIITSNFVLLISIAVLWTYFYKQYRDRTNEKKQDRHTMVPPNQFVSSAAEVIPIYYLAEQNRPIVNLMGLGMFSPNMFENKVLYFYGNLNMEKPLIEHTPTDSITFKEGSHGSFDIATAPPYLVPEHLKLDYDILYFKVVSVTDDFLEVIVNTSTQHTTFVNKRAGTFKYWPEFFLSVNSVEFINPEYQEIYIKPLEHAATVNLSYSFMRPLKVREDWMYVLLLDDDFNKKGLGWIKWREEGKFLISYSLLS
ncbi:MAG: hypothetical protein IPM47_19120 [Sphingobacteriales bacterium]|nr:MAG: hypothetical protein IPM47_19120 [Sphingobacteriales bacterium]